MESRTAKLRWHFWIARDLKGITKEEAETKGKHAWISVKYSLDGPEGSMRPLVIGHRNKPFQRRKGRFGAPKVVKSCKVYKLAGPQRQGVESCWILRRPGSVKHLKQKNIRND